MLFSSYTFLFVFLPAVLVFYFLLPLCLPPRRRLAEPGGERAPAGQTAPKGAVSAAEPPAPAAPERPAGADLTGYTKMGKERI